MTKTHIGISSCGYCGNVSNMNAIGSVPHMKEYNINAEDYPGAPREEGYIYSILECPKCKQINIEKYWYDSEYELEEGDIIEGDHLFPIKKNIPFGLPENILKAYSAAEQVKGIDTNAYVILLRRLLELVCIDRISIGGTLAKKLQYLASKGEIPDKLVQVAMNLKDFGNIGAHAGLGDISNEKIPIVTALCDALLEYIYTAPYIANVAELRLKNIKKNDYKV